MILLSKSLTANRPLIHTCLTYPKLNMDDFSVQAGPLGHGYSTKKISWNSLHAEKGIGKGKGFGIIHICYKKHKNYRQRMSSLRGPMVTSLDCHSGDPGSNPR